MTRVWHVAFIVFVKAEAARAYMTSNWLAGGDRADLTGQQ